MGGSKSSNQKRSGSPATRARLREAKAAKAQNRKRKRTTIIVAVVAVLALAGAGVMYALSRTAATRTDLSSVGTGVPAVVQVHDTACPFCVDLRNNVRSIEREFSDSELLIRVAELHTDEGSAFARRFGAQRVTLLFLDGEGNLVTSQTGVQEPAALRRTFERHAAGEL